MIIYSTSSFIYKFYFFYKQSLVFKYYVKSIGTTKTVTNASDFRLLKSKIQTTSDDHWLYVVYFKSSWSYHILCRSVHTCMYHFCVLYGNFLFVLHVGYLWHSSFNDPYYDNTACVLKSTFLTNNRYIPICIF